MKKLLAASVGALSVAATFAVAPTSAVASQRSVDPPSAGQMPSEVPSAITPQVTGDNVTGIASVGSQIVIGGPFKTVGGVNRTGIAAMDATTGALNTAFNPTVTGSVITVLPGPVDNTVYVAGNFTAINGTAVKNLALLNTLNGSVVTTFKSPAMNGEIDDLDRVGNRLYLGGSFTKIGNTPLGGLGTLNATTGTIDTFMQVKLTVRHNDGVSGAAVAPVGATSIAVSPDGTKLVAIGNFRKADGLDRVQAVMVDLTGATAAVKPDWATTGYVPACYNGAYDSYMRGLAFSPDGTYFVISATGGGNSTLCDTASRWETNATGTNVQPTWVNYSGGDTYWATAVTSSAVFVGGHQRWANNQNGNDFAGSGAVPRPGLVALDPKSGRPLSWNPGRNPRGVSVKSMLATDKGLWIGHDTQYIGNRKYKRQELAFFPYAGGTTLPSTSTATLPATVYVARGGSGAGANVLYRVDAGGGLISSQDSGPDWADDSGSDSPYRNSGSNTAGYDPGVTLSPSVPAGTPSAIFDSERWDPNDGNEMQWHFPVATGTHVQVRLYLANRCACTSAVGQRLFSVDLDGQRVLTNEDLVADVGNNVGTMKAFNITSDGTVDIQFDHNVENPLVNGIEIVNTDLPTGSGSTSALTSSSFNGATATPAAPVTSAIDWSAVRGAFSVGPQVFFGRSDGTFWRAPFDGKTLGTPTQVDPYHDPAWKNVDTGSGQTYDGASPSFYSQLANVGGMFYADGKLYYTQAGSPTLRSLWFSPDSGIVDSNAQNVTSSISFANAGGMFATGGQLYYVDRTDGSMYKVAFSGGVVSGSPTQVTSVAGGGPDWRGRALFVGNPPPNKAPTASFTSTCSGLTCSFDGSASTDSDGTVQTYAWNFGDGQTGTGATTSHTYSGNGPFTATLTVTDDQSGTGSTTRTVQPVAPSAGTGFVGQGVTTDAKAATKAVTPPASTQVGDLMLLHYTGNTAVPTAPSGWTQLKSQSTGQLNTTVWSRTATAADLGQPVTLTQTSAQSAIIGLAVYRGFSSVASTTVTTDSASATHSTPAVPTNNGDEVVSLWSDKSSSTTAWTAPDALSVRTTSIGTGSGRVSVVLADPGAQQSDGSYPAQTATTNAPSTKGIGFAIVLRP